MSFDFTVDSFLSAALKKTKLEDFGNESFLEGLNILINSCNHEGRLNDFGRDYIHYWISQCLVNRLKVQDWVTRHPEILDEKIERPLFITGLPRTGTTFLQTLLSVDPSNRALYHWEANRPCPPPELVFSVTDPRIQKMHESYQMIELLKPELQAIYPMDAGDFAECQELLSNEFKSTTFICWISIPTYTEWLLNCDMHSAYAYHRLLLQLLQWRFPNERWILKAPMHMFWLDDLLDQYPDAQIIFTHRDPVKAVTSFASLISVFRSLFSDEIVNYKNGRFAFQKLPLFADNAMKDRNRREPQAFYDLQFLDLIADPIGSVKSIYEYFGRKVSIGHERRMKVWMRDNPPGKRGRHHYSTEKFGIDPSEVRKRFDQYQERFKVPIEN